MGFGYLRGVREIEERLIVLFHCVGLIMSSWFIGTYLLLIVSERVVGFIGHEIHFVFELIILFLGGSFLDEVESAGHAACPRVLAPRLRVSPL